MKTAEMLRFADDQVLVVVERTVRTIALSGGHEHEHELDVSAERVIDLVGFPDQIWVAARDDVGGAVLRRFTLDGQLLGGAPLALPSPLGRWVAAPREACAAWQGAAPVIVRAAPDLGLTPLTERCDLVMPFSPGRVVMARGLNAMLRTTGGLRWSTSVFAPSVHVEDGAFLYDASSIALVGISGAGARSIAVLTTRDGAVQQRLSVAAGASIQIAARRGQALVQIGDHRLLLIDLRFARTVGDYEHPEAISAVAINPSATAIAILTRDASGGVALSHLSSRELITHTSYVAPVLAAPVVAALTDEPEPERAPDAGAFAEATPVPQTTVESAEPAPTMRFDVVDPPALLPRSRAARADPAQARALLEGERAVIAASCYLATARAWDQGRIVWDSESEHPYETELLGLLDRQRGRAVERIAEATRARAASEAARTTSYAAVTALSPIDELGRELALSPLARTILLVVAAPTIWGEVARMYGILANDSGRAVVDEMLIRQVLGDQADVHQIAHELDPDRPLVRRGAVRVGAGSMRPFLALHVDPLVIKWLRGDSLGDGAEADLRVVETSRPIEQLLLPPGVLEHLREALCRTTTAPLRLIVRGRAGAGRKTLIAALAHTANRKLAMLDAAPLVRDGRIRTEDIALRLQRAALGGWLPCVDNLEIVGHDDRSAREQLQEIFRRHPGPVAFRLGSDATPPLDPGYLAVDLPPLSETRRLDAWNIALAERRLVLTDVGDLASRWVLGPGTVHRVLDQLVERGGTAGQPAEVVSRLDGVIRQHLETRLGDLATRMTRLARWSQIVLPPDILDSLLELVARIRHRRTVFERWGYDRVMTSSRGVTALFQGGPGTGKTMVASAVARELGLDVYRVDLSRIVSKWIGETERNLAQLFDAAEDGQAMILFDEADSLFARRTEVKTSVDRYANLEVNYLLQRLDSFGGIAILTTNFGGAIDTAFKRRLSFRLSFPFPDDEMREQLWRVHLPPELPRAGDLDFGELARKYKMSGGYIRNAALRAAFLAAAEESGLHHDHLERAVRLEYREIGKLAETGALE